MKLLMTLMIICLSMTVYAQKIEYKQCKHNSVKDVQCSVGLLTSDVDSLCTRHIKARDMKRCGDFGGIAVSTGKLCRNKARNGKEKCLQHKFQIAIKD